MKTLIEFMAVKYNPVFISWKKLIEFCDTIKDDMYSISRFFTNLESFWKARSNTGLVVYSLKVEWPDCINDEDSYDFYIILTFTYWEWL